MKNLPLKDKIFWKNFLSFIVIFLFITFLFAYTRNDDGESIGFVASYTFTSIFCVLYLGVKIGQHFSKYEDINNKRDEFLKKEKLSIQEFHKRYKDVISIYNEPIKFFDDIKKEENKCDTYEFVNNTGGKEKITLGYKDSEKCDIYWDDVVASKNNVKEIVTPDGMILEMSNFNPEEALNFINKKCPYCGDNIDRFFFISDEKREWEYNGWMEACLKCKKLIHFDVDVMD
jgi:hypothetical protein